ncbi:MAG: sulfatase-like hydrolase/transferase [Candidatus Latescibacteria bacterium]|nr:sulfatase-like hydrolase/transferase [Candidatus Latescibacterota bacterium]
MCPKDLYDEYYDRVEIPQVPLGYLDRLHPAVQLWREIRRVNGLTEEQVRKARAAYYGLVTYMDEEIGRLLGVLASTSYGEDTAVAYVSDHGEMAGEHGMWWKSSFYEGSAGVPMIWSWPGHLAEGRRVPQVTSLLDVGSTLLDLAGAAPLLGTRGRSLGAFLTGSGDAPRDWPDDALSENYSGRGEPPARMVREGPWKLNHYHGYDAPQLFNIEEDPEEFHDRAGDPACADVQARLLARAREEWDGGAIADHVASRADDREALRAWASTVEHDLSDFWQAPEGCNLFPED